VADAGFTHSEAFLQWIWENMLFNFTELKTTSGKDLTVFNPGTLNTSDGPDFKAAHLEIDGVRWFGDVEIHTQSSLWKSHGHHSDSNYNSVVLHVVVEKAVPKSVTTENGSRPFTLNLHPYLSQKIKQFLHSFKQPSALPCASGLHFISEKAFYQQLEKAHTEYFERKTNDFLTFYDPDLIPSKAWKQALVISIWDGLGISHNRQAMQETARRLLQQGIHKTPQKTLDHAYQIAGFASQQSDISWNLKSVRPANHPKNRIREAVLLTHQVMQEPFGHFLETESVQLWSNWLEAATLNFTIRFKVLFGTVYLPAIYLLGNLLASKQISEQAYETWNQLKTPVPASLLKKFTHLDLEDNSYRKKLGAVHQLKAYCRPGKCSECFVLKKAIES
jgi:hypothetical protein